MADKAFWNDRLSRYGHTGWADAATYAYDQRLRLKCVAALMDSLGLFSQQRALDFGCGSGDFSLLLSTRFKSITGCDISTEILDCAKRRVQSADVHLTTDRQEAFRRGPFDLIVSITVLQHVLDDEQLRELVRGFATSLAPTGRVLILETLSLSGSDQNGYLRWRTGAQLCDIFGAAGLSLMRERGFHHPVEAPSPGYRAYRKRLDVRCLARLAAIRIRWAQRWLDRIAIRSVADDHCPEAPDLSSTRFMVFGPSSTLP